MFYISDFLAGWISGTVGIVVSHPFETIKVRQQNYNKRIIPTILQTYKYEKIRGFYKGVLLPLMIIGPYTSVFFGTYNGTIRYLQENEGTLRIIPEDPDWLMHVFYAGNIAGFVQAVMFCPVELIKTVLQANMSSKGTWNKTTYKCRGMFDCFKTLHKTGGITMLYKGLVPLLWRDVLTSGCYMVTYEYLFHTPPYDLNDTASGLIAGGVAGIVSWGFVAPIDVIKSRIQADDMHKPEYKGMIDCAKKLHKEAGFRVFTKGSVLLVVRGFILNALTFYVFEKSLFYLHEQQ